MSKVSQMLVLSTVYLCMKISLSRDIILCGWLNLKLKHQLTDWLTVTESFPLGRSELCLWQMYKVSQTVDLVWRVNVLHRFCDILVQVWVTLCSAMFNCNISLCYAVANVLSTLALWQVAVWQTFISVSVCSTSHKSARTSGSLTNFCICQRLQCIPHVCQDKWQFCPLCFSTELLSGTRSKTHKRLKERFLIRWNSFLEQDPKHTRD